MTAIRGADFGPCIIETDIDSDVISTLRLWLPHYLLRIEEERSLDVETIARPRPESYETALTEDDMLFRQLPAILVTTATPEEDAQKDGDGNYYAAWRVIVTAVVRGASPPKARWVAALFGGSVRRCLTQQQFMNLDGEIVWRRGNVAPVGDSETESRRYLAACINTFTAYVEGVMNERGGPVEPPVDPYRPDPENPAPYDPLVRVEEVGVEIEGDPVTGG